MSRVALLDVNVLVALFDRDHIHHDLAHDWFSAQRANGWATCPITENGLVRILSHPRAATGLRASEIVGALRKFRSSGHHHFWPDLISIATPAIFRAEGLAGSKQVTDAYLLALARHHNGTLATFDRSISLQAVAGATRSHLQVVTAVD